MIRSHARLSELQTLAVLDALHRRLRRLSWVPNVASSGVFVLWMVIFGKGTDALEGTRYDLLAFLQRQGEIGLAFGMIHGVGMAAALAACAYIIIRRRLLFGALRHHLSTPSCFHCGYTLTGLPAPNALIACPECGNQSRTVQPR